MSSRREDNPRDARVAELHDLQRRVDELRAELGVVDAQGLPASMAEAGTQREVLLLEAERIANMGSWIWNLVTNEIVWSDQMCRIYGYVPGSFTPTEEHFFSAIHPDDMADVLAVVQQSEDGSPPLPVEFRVVRTDGEIRDVRLEAAMTESSGVAHMVGTVLDRTDAKVMERRLQTTQKMTAVATLAGGVAHDFNNYLTVISGHVAMMRRGENDAGTDRHLEAIALAATHCAHLTRRLLSVGRVQQTDAKPTDLAAVIRSAAPLLTSLLSERVTLHLELPDTPVYVRVDPIQVEQIVSNLCANARDAIDGSGEVTIRLEPGDSVRLRVVDDGNGMEPEVAERVFEPFFTTQPTGQGTGLGLSTVYAIVRDAGGSARVESNPGQGTHFVIDLPGCDAPQPVDEEGGAGQPQASAARRVLLVEDNDALRLLIATYLEAAGYAVRVAEDGERALALARGSRFDVLLTDAVMPGMGGIALLRELEGLEPRPKFLLMTGYARGALDDLDDLLGLRVLHKPFELSALTDAIEASFLDDGE